MKVRLTRKLAERIDGISLEGRSVGDVFDVPEPEARLLIAEEWGDRRLGSRPTLNQRRAEDRGYRQDDEYRTG
jgi:hypothetical protein